MRKFLLYLNLLCLTLMIGCKDGSDFVKVNEFGSSLEVSENYKISQFTLSNRLLRIAEKESNILIELTSHSSGEKLTLDGEIREVAEHVRGAIFIPHNTTIADSDYDVLLRDSEGDAFGARFKISIKGEMFCSVLEERINYYLDGSGDVNDPYIIKSSDDFYEFLCDLADDSLTHGANLHFRQEASFEAPGEGLHDNEGYLLRKFAGHYDGNKQTIGYLTYAGSGSDQNVGLFSELLDGAFIENLNLRSVDIQRVRTAGSIAGLTQGNVTLSRITVDGSISSTSEGNDDRFGGLVGSASEGTLTIQNCHSRVSIEGGDNIGGLIGRAGSNISLVLQSDTVSKKTFIGNNYVGGAIGYLEGSVVASNILISHTVSNDTKVVYAKGAYAGGLIGKACIKGKSNIKNIRIECPVESPENIGGLIGYITTSAETKFEGCRVTYSISGQKNVGGMFGQIDSNYYPIIFGSANAVTELHDSSISITGYNKSENIGGVIGLSQKAYLKFTAPIFVSVGVSAVNGDNIGGFFGKAVGNGNTTFTISDAWRHDHLMSVIGKKNVGGFVGYAEKITLQDKMNFTMQTTANEKYKDDNPAFSAKVGDGTTSTNVGGIVGYALQCTFKNIYVNGSVYGVNNCGGIVGYGVSLNFDSCVSDLTKLGITGKMIGGIAGYSSNTNLKNCINYSNVSNGLDYSGGIIGCWESGGFEVSLSECVNVGTISGTMNVGGIIGYFNGTCYMTNSANYGSISGASSGNDHDDSGVGGIIGRGITHLTIQGCANHGDVYGSNNYDGVGGIAGLLGEDGILSTGNKVDLNSTCNFAVISSTEDDAKLGGIVGYMEEGYMHDHNDVHIENCYNMGAIPTRCSSDNGGILGLISQYNSLRLCYNAGKITQLNAIVGTHSSNEYGFSVENCYFLDGSGADWKAEGGSRSDSQMRDLDNFKGFSKDIWKTGSYNNGYPYLANCPFQFATFSK